MNYLIFTDGGSRGNPGPSGAGGIIKHPDGTIIATVSEFLGHQTNNYAEYKALYLTLCESIKQGILNVEVYMDSKLIVEQILGRWQVKTPSILPLHLEVKGLIPKFNHITFTHIYRKYNVEADKLANDAMDSPQGVVRHQVDSPQGD
jgi:ribonuclease HI